MRWSLHRQGSVQIWYSLHVYLQWEQMYERNHSQPLCTGRAFCLPIKQKVYIRLHSLIHWPLGDQQNLQMETVSTSDCIRTQFYYNDISFPTGLVIVKAISCYNYSCMISNYALLCLGNFYLFEYCSDRSWVYFKYELIIIFYHLIKTFLNVEPAISSLFNVFPLSGYCLHILNWEERLPHKTPASVSVAVILYLFSHYMWFGRCVSFCFAASSGPNQNAITVMAHFRLMSKRRARNNSVLL